MNQKYSYTWLCFECSSVIANRSWDLCRITRRLTEVFGHPVDALLLAAKSSCLSPAWLLTSLTKLPQDSWRLAINSNKKKNRRDPGAKSEYTKSSHTHKIYLSSTTTHNTAIGVYKRRVLLRATSNEHQVSRVKPFQVSIDGSDFQHQRGIFPLFFIESSTDSILESKCTMNSIPLTKLNTDGDEWCRLGIGMRKAPHSAAQSYD